MALLQLASKCKNKSVPGELCVCGPPLGPQAAASTYVSRAPMCPMCADLNWLKRTATADLCGRVALVTGARVKIGYEIVLFLLRAGCRVIATTRFACDAARRFQQAPDFEVWRDRLELRALDLRTLQPSMIFAWPPH